jgi:hypothetical protein
MASAAKLPSNSDTNILICATLTASLDFIIREYRKRQAKPLSRDTLAMNTWPTLNPRERRRILDSEFNFFNTTTTGMLDILVDQLNQAAARYEIPATTTTFSIRRSIPLGSTEPVTLNIGSQSATEAPPATAMAAALQAAQARKAAEQPGNAEPHQPEEPASPDAVVEYRKKMKRLPINPARLEHQRQLIGATQTELSGALEMSPAYYGSCLRAQTAPKELLDLLRLTPEQAMEPPPQEEPQVEIPAEPNPPEEVLGLHLKPATAGDTMPDATPAPPPPASNSAQQMLDLITSLDPHMAMVLLGSRKTLAELPEGIRQSINDAMNMLLNLEPNQRDTARKLLGL